MLRRSARMFPDSVRPVGLAYAASVMAGEVDFTSPGAAIQRASVQPSLTRSPLIDESDGSTRSTQYFDVYQLDNPLLAIGESFQWIADPAIPATYRTLTVFSPANVYAGLWQTLCYEITP
jgi:hypothetical protein